MYKRANDVLGTLKFDITGAAASLVVAPIAATSFVLPPAPTDGAATWGQPFVLIALTDRLDSSQAKYELILCSARVAEAAGAFTYTVAASGRGWEGSTAQAWTAGAYALLIASDDMLSDFMHSAVNRAQSLLVHKRDGLFSWDGTNFKFDSYSIVGAGRGKHWFSDGLQTISMPANATVVKGYGGAADTAIASSTVPIAAKTALYYEPNISAAGTMIAGNLRLVATTGDFQVPNHWILIAVNTESVAGDAMLRLASGPTLHPWRDVAALALFTNSWVNFGAPYDNVAFRRDEAGWVHMRGAAKSGTVNLAMFTLPVGYRPANEMRFAIDSNAAYGVLSIDGAGVVKMPSGGSNVVAHLNPRPFQAAS